MTDATNTAQPSDSDKAKGAAAEIRALKTLLHYKLQTVQSDVNMPTLVGKSGYYLTVGMDENSIQLLQSPAGAGSAGDLASQLANSTDPLKGAGLVNFNYALAYAGGSVGKAIQSMYKFCAVTQPLVVVPAAFANVTGVYTPNSKLAFLELAMCGGGGSGGGSPAPGSTTQYCLGGSGGGSPYVRLLIPAAVINAYAATNGGVINYQVGAAVAGGNQVIGNDGNDSWFGISSGSYLLTTPGGYRGVAGIPTASSTSQAFLTSSDVPRSPAISALITAYVIEKITGGPANASFQIGGVGVVGKSGGSKFGSGVSPLLISDSNGRDGSNYGEGGGGSWRLYGASGSSGLGGKGAPGYMSLTEYLLPN
mgnify:CR=1 FL=1